MKKKLLLCTFLIALCSTGLCLAMEHQTNEGTGHHALSKADDDLDLSLIKQTRNKVFVIQMSLPEKGLSVGFNELNLSVKSPEGGAVGNAVVTVRPWMPGMGHGVTVVPVIKEEGVGVYRAEKVGFSMPGYWQLIVSVTQKDRQDEAIFEFPDIKGGESSVGSKE